MCLLILPCPMVRSRVNNNNMIWAGAIPSGMKSLVSLPERPMTMSYLLKAWENQNG